jgi:rubrerythrin
MTDSKLTLLDAIQVAMAAEKKAAAFYADAARSAANPLGRQLFEDLADFERYHYDTLAELDGSLRDDGAYVPYAGRELELPTPAEVEVEEVHAQRVVDIISLALNAEREARERYTRLAEQTADPDGKAMFERLAAEEHVHYRILNDEYYHLNNHGKWVWAE